VCIIGLATLLLLLPGVFTLSAENVWVN